MPDTQDPLANVAAAPEIKEEPTLDFDGRPIGVGDVVALRHAEFPLMTVEFADGTDRSNLVSAVWHDANDQLQRQTFQGKTLVICDEIAPTQETLDS